MAEASFDALERQQLCDLFVELGPDAPTLLEAWSTRDLAAHLVLREHDYLAAPGLVLPGRWHRFAERRTATLAERDFALARRSSQVGAAAWLLPHRLGAEISQPQRVLRASRGRAPGERPGAAERCGRSRRSPVAQRGLRTVDSCSAPPRRGTRARVGRDKRASTSPARRADGSARRTARRTAAVSLRAASRRPGRGRGRARRRCRRSRHIVRHVSAGVRTPRDRSLPGWTDHAVTENARFVGSACRDEPLAVDIRLVESFAVLASGLQIIGSAASTVRPAAARVRGP